VALADLSKTKQRAIIICAGEADDFDDKNDYTRWIEMCRS